MSSFFSSFGKTLGDDVLAKKAQTHQEDLQQQQQYLQVLHDAANSPAAQSWSADQWKTYTDAVINAGDVKSQKDPKKSGLSGLMQKITGGPKGGSNLQEKLQQIFAGQGGGSPMAQTSAAGAPAPDAPATQSRYGSGSSPIQGVSGQISPPFTNQVAGAPDTNALQPSSGPALGPMPESFAPRTGAVPSLQKTARGASAPPSAPSTLTMGGGPVTDYGQRPDLILRDPATGHHVGHYVGKNGKVSTIDYGPGQTETEYNQQLRAAAQVEKAKAIKQGDLDSAIALGIKMGDYADYDTGLQVEGPKWQAFQHAKWNAPFEKERAARAAEVDRAGRLAQRTAEYGLNYNKYLLSAHGQQRADAEFAYKQTEKAVTPIDDEIKQLEGAYSKLQAERDKLYATPPNPRLNPNDTQDAHDAKIDQYNDWMNEYNEKLKAARVKKDALLGSDPWMKTQDLAQPVAPPPRTRRPASGPPARKPPAPSGDPSNPMGLKRPGQ